MSERGRIQVVRRYTAVCGRCQFSAGDEACSDVDTYELAERTARGNGWAKSRQDGWICPDCAAKKDNVAPAGRQKLNPKPRR